MTARLAALLPRLAALIVIGLLAATSLTFAAASNKLKAKEDAAAQVQVGPKTLRTPDVRGQAYVFAKGILEDAGFAWRVVGSVDGYAANLVALQNPAPETLVFDTGTPTIELRLERNPAYSERGLPENSSPYDGTALRLVADPDPADEGEQEPADPGNPEGQGAEPKPSDEAKKDEPRPKEDEPALEEKPEEEPAGTDSRKPDFVVEGAPVEPADEMPLPDRAKLVEERIAAANKPTKALVNWWLYQHAWIVTGASFGWHDGDEALRILIRVDRSIMERWDFGAKSARLAERVLAKVEDGGRG